MEYAEYSSPYIPEIICLIVLSSLVSKTGGYIYASREKNKVSKLMGDKYSLLIRYTIKIAGVDIKAVKDAESPMIVSNIPPPNLLCQQ